MTIAIIGHRKIERTQELERKVEKTIEDLILNEGADVFLFGSKSAFNDLCLEVVTKLKEKYPQIRRIYLRAEYEYIDDSYRDYLLSTYEETEFPSRVHGAGMSSYIKRNEVMIEQCDKVLFYFDENYTPIRRRYPANSGTKLSMEFAKRKNKPYLNLFERI